jgi:hypothetical protein
LAREEASEAKILDVTLLLMESTIMFLEDGVGDRLQDQNIHLDAVHAVPFPGKHRLS